MRTSFLVLLTFLFFQRFGNTIIISSSSYSSSNVTCIEKERQSLLVFKQNLTNNFNVLSTWRGVECCEWHGVECDSRNGHVVKLDLRSTLSPHDAYDDNATCLAGELSPSLQNLKHLRYLDLSMNLFGEIPKFLGSFEQLEYLNLSSPGNYYNREVLHHLGNLSRLQYLDLSQCFSGYACLSLNTIGDLGWVSSLTALRYLDLSGKSIGENIDWLYPINMLPSLHTLNLAGCGIKYMSSIKSVNFTSLYSLDLSWNEINSTIPVWLSNLTSLTHLNFHHSQFHGKVPDFIGTLSALVSFDLSSNSIESSVPVMLCNLSNLVHLDLSRNKIVGPIPASLGLLSSLENLKLHENQLSGIIPISLGQLSKLKTLDLSYNFLIGVLSETHFTTLKSLNYLAFSWNSLELNFSSQWNAPFQLQIFDASNCNMIGHHFPNWLQTQRNLHELVLSNSSIKDIIPNWFKNITSRIQYLDLSFNQISGKVPRFHFHSTDPLMLNTLKINSNKFEGLVTFPTNVMVLDLSDNLLSGHVPQTDGIVNPSLKVVNLSKNRFTGSIPLHLCKVTSIKVLDLSHNKFSGRLSRCLGNLTRLIVIDLTNNTITGVLPSSLGNLEDLMSLHLRNNKFEGDIPTSFQNMTQLATMNLGNNFFMGIIPFWIREKLSNLEFLDLHSNKFTDKIPLQLCQLTALQYLSLAHNDLTGTIPHCLGNLRGMMKTFNDDHPVSTAWYEENILAYMKGRELLYTTTMKYLTSLDLASNNINGEIPNSLMNLTGLKNLNLSRNLLKGQIPITIGNLKQLESLDLSINKLSGQIPKSVTSLNSLSYLNLSFNSLSGPIPIGNQLQTLDDPSIYEGNNSLCGPPISKICNGNNVTYHHVDAGENEDEDDTDGLWFYAGLGPGFVVGFMGLLGSLHFNRRWRVVYSKMLKIVCG